MKNFKKNKKTHSINKKRGKLMKFNELLTDYDEKKEQLTDAVSEIERIEDGKDMLPVFHETDIMDDIIYVSPAVVTEEYLEDVMEELQKKADISFTPEEKEDLRKSLLVFAFETDVFSNSIPEDYSFSIGLSIDTSLVDSLNHSVVVLQLENHLDETTIFCKEGAISLDDYKSLNMQEHMDYFKDLIGNSNIMELDKDILKDKLDTLSEKLDMVDKDFDSIEKELLSLESDLLEEIDLEFDEED